MQNPTAIIPRCTAQRSNGEFCDMPSGPDMPFPICMKHASRVAAHVTSEREMQIHALKLELARAAPRPGPSDEYVERMQRRKAALDAQVQVYYVTIGDHIKIGYSNNIRSRMSALRVPVTAVLATEPGGRTVERARHLEFADLRDGRKEDFFPDERLQRHIELIRETYGPPKITDYPHVE